VSKSKLLLKKTCLQCGSEFETRLACKKYCDLGCKRIFNREKQRFRKTKKNYVLKNPTRVFCCVCGSETIIDNPHKEIPIFYCTKCLKEYGGKTPNSKIEGWEGRRIGVPELNLDLERKR